MRLLITLAVAALLAACSTFSDLLPEHKKIEYKSAGKLPPLEIPPDLTAPGRDNRYSVPDVAAAGGSATYSSYSAERSGAALTASSEVLPKVDAGKVRIERSGTERWLVVPESSEKVWPVVKAFWQELGFLIRIDQPEVGVMETDWAEDRAKIPNDGIRTVLGKLIDTVYSTGERDKFRTRIERAPGGGTEIYISHRGMIEVYTSKNSVNDNTIWQPRQPDPALEAEFLRRLMVRFGVDDQRAQTQISQGGTPEHAKLVSGADGVDTLQLDEPFDRAWRRVGLALDRVGFTVEDRDRAKGYYYVRYVDPEIDVNTKKPDGFVSKLMFWRSDKPDKNKNEQYRVLVKQQADTSQVQVLNKDGVDDKSDTARKILTLLQAQLK